MRTDWPNGAEVAVSLTFDVDAESGWLGEDAAYTHRLSTLSEGAVRHHARPAADPGDPRRHEIKATFYVPGDTAERHTTAIERDRRRRATRSATTATCTCAATRSRRAEQREEIERGLEALEAASASRRRGYRSPRWELTPETFALLKRARVRLGQQPDGRRPPVRRTTGCSSCPCTGASTTGRTCTGSRAAATRSPRRRRSWTPGWRSSSRRSRDRRHVTYTMHPEVIGRGYRAQLLDGLIAEMRARAKVWFAAHGDVAALVMG